MTETNPRPREADAPSEVNLEDLWIEDALFPPGIPEAGTDAGIEPHELMQRPTSKGSVRVVCIDYALDNCQVEEVTDLHDFLGRHRPSWSVVRWIAIHGLTDMEVVRAFAEKYQLHPLAIEDVLTLQRPKVEDYPGSSDWPGRLFVVARMIRMIEDRPVSEQISFFLGRRTLISFDDFPPEVILPLRHRIEAPNSRLRGNDASFLLYFLLDAIIDGFFPILEEYGDRIEELETRVLGRPKKTILPAIHRLKRDLGIIRRVAWPMRELILELRRKDHECLSANTLTYLRDVYDHALLIFEHIESYRDVVSTLMETYMTLVSNRMNDIMKTLTIISTIFVPLTFLAGVYGMNMPIPENHSPWMYPLFWGISVVTIGGMLLWFKWRQWF